MDVWRFYLILFFRVLYFLWRLSVHLFSIINEHWNQIHVFILLLIDNSSHPDFFWKLLLILPLLVKFFSSHQLDYHEIISIFALIKWLILYFVIGFSIFYGLLIQINYFSLMKGSQGYLYILSLEYLVLDIHEKLYKDWYEMSLY